MSRLVLLLAVLGLALPAAAQPAVPQAYRLDVLTPTSAFVDSPGRAPFLPGSRTWTATLDGKRISESRFYDIVGRPEMARAALQRRNGAATLAGASLAVGAAGMLLIARGTPTLRECRGRRRGANSAGGCDAFNPAMTLGGTALVVGSVVGISVALPLTQRGAPARDAAAEARRFNDDGR